MSKYQPVHPAGDVGPKFASATEAALWIFLQPDSHRWDIQLVSAVTGEVLLPEFATSVNPA